MNYDQLADQFWQDGYIHLRQFFSAAQLAPVDEVVRKHFGVAPDYYHNEEFLENSSTDVIPWFPKWDGLTDFDFIEQDERFIELSQAILGSGWRSLYCMCMFSKPHSQGQAWHQDCPPENERVFNLNRLVYTSTIENKNGGQLVLVPGSHRNGRISCGEVDETLPNQLILQPEIGDVVFLHGHCWHRVLPIKEKSRLSTNFRCAPIDTPDDVTDISIYRNMVYRFSTSEILEKRC